MTTAEMPTRPMILILSVRLLGWGLQMMRRTDRHFCGGGRLLFRTVCSVDAARTEACPRHRQSGSGSWKPS